MIHNTQNLEIIYNGIGPDSMIFTSDYPDIRDIMKHSPYHEVQAARTWLIVFGICGFIVGAFSSMTYHHVSSLGAAMIGVIWITIIIFLSEHAKYAEMRLAIYKKMRDNALMF